MLCHIICKNSFPANEVRREYFLCESVFCVTSFRKNLFFCVRCVTPLRKKSAVLKHTLLTITSPSFAVYLRPSSHIVFIAASILRSTLCHLLPVASCLPCVVWCCMTFAVTCRLPLLAAWSKSLPVHHRWTFVVAWCTLSLNAWRSVVAKVRVTFSGKL